MAHSCDLPKMARLQCDNYGHGLTWTNMDYHGLSWTIMDHHEASWTIMDYHCFLLSLYCNRK